MIALTHCRLTPEHARSAAHTASALSLSTNILTMVPTPQELQQMKVNQIKDLLKLEKLPVSVSGNNTLSWLPICRLQKYRGKPKPNKEWQYSKAKKLLKSELLDPNSDIHNMSVDEIWVSKPEYDQYPLFKKYFSDLKERVEVSLLWNQMNILFNSLTCDCSPRLVDWKEMRYRGWL